MVERIDINRVLVEMRSLKAQAQGRNIDIPTFDNKVGETKTNGPQFGDLLKNAVNKVNSTQMQADTLARAFESGDTRVDLPDVMIAVQKASISFEAMKQVRNKLVAAYQDIMNMPL